MININFKIEITGDENRQDIKQKVLKQYKKEIENKFTFDEYFLNHSVVYGEVDAKGKTSETFGIVTKDVILTIDEYNTLKTKADLLDRMRKLDE